MTTPQLARLDEHLQRLRLHTVRERLEALLQEASTQELSYADFLDRLLSEEVTARHRRKPPATATPPPTATAPVVDSTPLPQTTR